MLLTLKHLVRMSQANYEYFMRIKHWLEDQDHKNHSFDDAITEAVAVLKQNETKTKY